MRHIDQQQAWYLGIALVLLGILTALNLWWLMPIVVTIGVGVLIYIQQRRDGNTVRAVQGGFWLIGLAMLFLLRPFLPIYATLLILIGTSLLMRGQEHKIDAMIQQSYTTIRQHITNLLRKRQPTRDTPTQVPIDSHGNGNGNGPSYDDYHGTQGTTRL